MRDQLEGAKAATKRQNRPCGKRSDPEGNLTNQRVPVRQQARDLLQAVPSACTAHPRR